MEDSPIKKGEKGIVEISFSIEQSSLW